MFSRSIVLWGALVGTVLGVVCGLGIGTPYVFGFDIGGALFLAVIAQIEAPRWMSDFGYRYEEQAQKYFETLCLALGVALGSVPAFLIVLAVQKLR